MSSLYIVMPAYNEEQNIEKTIEDWYPVIEKHNGSGLSRLVIIDDGSKDCTYNKMLEIAKDKPLFLPLTKSNQGHGPTILYAYNYAIENNADYIFQTDSDGQTNPEEFDQFWRLKSEYDCIIGNRVCREDGKDRKFIENTVCLLLRIIFGVKVEDANAPFRLMKSSILKKYINNIPKDFNIPNIMFTTYFVHYNEKVKFIPISFRPREKGTNSINLKKIVKIGVRAVRDFLYLRTKM